MADQDTMRSLLEEPFATHQIKKRQGGRGQMFDYIPGEDVIQRLNDATGGCWDHHIKDITQREIVSTDRQGNHRTSQLVMAHVALTIPGMGTANTSGSRWSRTAAARTW